MNFQNQPILTKLAMIAVAKEWLNNYDFALSKYGELPEGKWDKINAQKELVWQVCDEEFNSENNDYSHILAVHRPDWTAISQKIGLNEWFNLGKITNDDQKLMVLDLLDDLFANAYIAVQADFAEKVERGWYYNDILHDMQTLNQETA